MSLVSSDVDPGRTFGALFIGFVLSTTLYGLTFFQTFLYFSRYPRDASWIKILIGLLWAIDTAATGLLSHAMYRYLITDFGLPFAGLTATNSLCAETGLATLTIYLVHVFYAVRIWSVSKKNAVVSIAITALATIAFAFGVGATVRLFQDKNVQSFLRGSLNTFTNLHTGLATLCDVLISAALSYYLRPAKNAAVIAPQSLVEKVILYVLSRGTVTVVVQFAFFLAFVSNPAQQIWVPFPVMIGKVYVNVMLVLLNYRESAGGQGIFEEEAGAPSSARTVRYGFGSRGVNMGVVKVGTLEPPQFRTGDSKGGNTMELSMLSSGETTTGGP